MPVFRIPAISILQRVRGESLDFEQQVMPADVGLDINHLGRADQCPEGSADLVEIAGMANIDPVAQFAQHKGWRAAQPIGFGEHGGDVGHRLAALADDVAWMYRLVPDDARRAGNEQDFLAPSMIAI